MVAWVRTRRRAALVTYTREVGGVVLGLSIALTGCLKGNPGFDGPTDSDQGTGTAATAGPAGPGTTSDPTTTGVPTTSPTGSETGTTTGVPTSSSSGTGVGPTTTMKPTTGTDATTDPSGSSSSTGGQPVFLEAFAEQAGCIILPMDMLPLVGPMPCEQASSMGNAHGGIGEMSADKVDALFDGREARILLRFAWEPELTGAEIVSVGLTLDVTDYPGEALSDRSGAIWRSEPFDLGAIGGAAPATVGNLPIGNDQGAVDVEEEVMWSLPTDVIVEGDAIYLQLLTDSNDGVNYWTKNGPFPELYPRIRIGYIP